MDHKELVTWRRAVKFYKVQWSNHSEEEATWETEDYLRTHYPEFPHWRGGLHLFWRGDLHLFCKSNLQLASLNSQGSLKVNLWKRVLRTTWREDFHVRDVLVVSTITVVLYSRESVSNKTRFSLCWFDNPVPPPILSQDQTWPCIFPNLGTRFL